MPDWQSIFIPAVPLTESVVRGTVTFFVLLALIRIVGQRESGGLGLTDVLIIVLVAEAAAPALYPVQATLTDGIVVVVATVLFWSVSVDAIAYRFPGFARLAKARPKALIADGKLNTHVMRREFMSRAEVYSHLRLHGIEDINRVRRAYLEPNGMISVLTHDTGPAD